MARGLVEGRRLMQRRTAVSEAEPVYGSEHLVVQRLEVPLGATRRKRRIGEDRDRDNQSEGKGPPEFSPDLHGHTVLKREIAIRPPLLPIPNLKR